MPPSAAHRVFNTTELLEMILLQDELTVHQLFVLQRVDKNFNAVMAGSQKLRVKMFLDYSSEDLAPEAGKGTEWLEKESTQSLFNPLTGPIRPQKLFVDSLVNQEKSSTVMALPVFRDFHLVLHDRPQGPQGRFFLKEGSFPIARRSSQYSLQKHLKPRLHGSWRDLKVCKIPIMLAYQKTLGQRKGTECNSLDRCDNLGQLVDILLGWYYVNSRDMAFFKAGVYFE